MCPTFQVPVGTGIGIFGGNGDIARNNYIYDNWRDGIKLLYVPAAFRGEPDKGIDTSFDNPFAGNQMGVRPDGTPDANGNDFWWDEQGKGNCWSGNTSHSGLKPSSNVVIGLPDCPGSQVLSPGNHAKTRQPGVVRDLGSDGEHATRPAATGSSARPSRRTTRRAPTAPRPAVAPGSRRCRSRRCRRHEAAAVARRASAAALAGLRRRRRRGGGQRAPAR